MVSEALSPETVLYLRPALVTEPEPLDPRACARRSMPDLVGEGAGGSAVQEDSEGQLALLQDGLHKPTEDK